jgi:hypothetical protein
VLLENGFIGYHFKLGDFGLGREFSPGQVPTPFPPAPNSSNQNPNFSTRDYNHIDDLYGVGYIMSQLRSHVNGTLDGEYDELEMGLLSLKYNAARAHAFAERKFSELMGRYY